MTPSSSSFSPSISGANAGSNSSSENSSENSNPVNESSDAAAPFGEWEAGVSILNQITVQHSERSDPSELHESSENEEVAAPTGDQVIERVDLPVPDSRVATCLPNTWLNSGTGRRTIVAVGVLCSCVLTVAGLGWGLHVRAASNQPGQPDLPGMDEVVELVRGWLNACDLCDPDVCEYVVKQVVGYLEVISDIGKYGTRGIYDACYTGDAPRDDLSSYAIALAHYLQQQQQQQAHSSAVPLAAQRLSALLISSVVAALQARWFK